MEGVNGDTITVEPPRIRIVMISVAVERIEPKSPGPNSRPRTLLGTEHYRLGTTANHVCEHVMKKYGSPQGMGLWLLQMKVSDPENHSEVEDGSYVTIKDSKYKLEEGKTYTVGHFTGTEGFLIMSS